MAGRSRYFTIHRSVLAERADFKDVAVIAGLAGNAELPAAIEPGHDRHHGHDGLAPGLLERGLYACLLAELDQVARGRERQFEPPALAALKCLARRDPDRVGGLLAVVGAELLRRSCGKEEPGVEPLWHALRRDPVCIGHELVEREQEAVVGQHLEKRRLALTERGAMRRLDLLGAAGIDQRARSLRSRQEDAAFLKGFADRGDAEA